MVINSLPPHLSWDGIHNNKNIKVDFHPTTEEEKKLSPSNWSLKNITQTGVGLKETADLLRETKDLTQIMRDKLQNHPKAYVVEYNLFFTHQFATSCPMVAKEAFKYARGGSAQQDLNIFQNIFGSAFSELFNHGTTLFNCKKEDHARLALPVQKSLGINTVNRYLPDVAYVIDQHCVAPWKQALKNGQTIDIDLWFHYLSTGTIAKITVGHDGPYPEIYKPALAIEQSIADVVIKGKAFNKAASEEVDKHLQAAQDKDQKSLLYRMNDDLKDDKRLDEKEIWNTIKFLFFAGTGNAAAPFRNMLYYLTQNQALQNELRQEIIDVLDHNKDQDLTFDTFIKELPKLKKLYYKLLRELPPSPLIGRAVSDQGVTLNIIDKNNDEIIEQHFLPPKAFFNYALFHVGKDPRNVGENPEELTLEQEEKLNTDLYIFSTGAEMCPGRYLVKKQTILGLALFLMQFKFECDQKDVTYIFKGTYKPKENLNFKLTECDEETVSYYKRILALKEDKVKS